MARKKNVVAPVVTEVVEQEPCSSVVDAVQGAELVGEEAFSVTSLDSDEEYSLPDENPSLHNDEQHNYATVGSIEAEGDALAQLEVESETEPAPAPVPEPASAVRTRATRVSRTPLSNKLREGEAKLAVFDRRIAQIQKTASERCADIECERDAYVASLTENIRDGLVLIGALEVYATPAVDANIDEPEQSFHGDGPVD